MSESLGQCLGEYFISGSWVRFNNWYSDKETWTVNNYATSRLGIAAFTVATLVTDAFDLLIGTFSGLLNLVTANQFETLSNRKAVHLDNSGKNIISHLYLNLILIINPFSKIQCCVSEIEFGNEPLVYAKGNGFLTNSVINKFKEIGNDLQNSDYRFNRHVTSRLCYLLAVPATVVSRVVDLAIGVIAAIFSIFPCFGKCKTLNNVAFRGLQVTGIVSDIFYFLTNAVNPNP